MGRRFTLPSAFRLSAPLLGQTLTPWHPPIHSAPTSWHLTERPVSCSKPNIEPGGAFDARRQRRNMAGASRATAGVQPRHGARHLRERLPVGNAYSSATRYQRGVPTKRAIATTANTRSCRVSSRSEKPDIHGASAQGRTRLIVAPCATALRFLEYLTGGGLEGISGRRIETRVSLLKQPLGLHNPG